MSHLEYYPEKNVKNLHFHQCMSIVVKLLWACAKSEPGGIQSKYVNRNPAIRVLRSSIKIWKGDQNGHAQQGTFWQQI